MTKLQKKKLTDKLVILVWIIGLIVIWEIGASIVETTKRSPQNVLPHLSQIVESVFSSKPVSNKQTAWQIVTSNATITLLRAGTGFLIGTLIGFILALAMNFFKLVEKAVFPYLMMIQMIPILGMAPIVLAITQDIDKSRIVISAILTFYPVATNMLDGLKSVEKEKYDLMHSLAASSWHIYTKLLLPTSIPYIFSGLKIAAPMAITASILVDTLQGGAGLGTMLSQSLKHAMSIYVFWQIVFFSAFIGILSYKLMSFAEKMFSPHEKAKGSR